MNNVEHPKHYQLSIELEVLDVIDLLLSKQKMHLDDYFYLNNAIKYLFIAETENELENCKNALNYLKQTNNIGIYSQYTATERMLIDKILENIENKKIDLIIYSVINLKLSLAKHYLREYIEEQEKQND